MLRINTHRSPLTIGHLPKLLSIWHICIPMSSFDFLQVSVLIKIQDLSTRSSEHPLGARVAVLSYSTRALNVSSGNILLT